MTVRVNVLDFFFFFNLADNVRLLLRLFLLKVIMDEKTLDVLVNYTAGALKACSSWTHSDVLLALSTIVYGNGPQCHQVGVCTNFVKVCCVV